MFRFAKLKYLSIKEAFSSSKYLRVSVVANSNMSNSLSPGLRPVELLDNICMFSVSYYYRILCAIPLLYTERRQIMNMILGTVGRTISR